MTDAIRPAMACALMLAATALAAGHASAQERKPAPKPSAATLLQMDDGRSGRGNLIATTGVRGYTKPALASAHALIMTIGDYRGDIPKLTGVPYDTATATEIAKRLGVPEANIRKYRDGELTIDGMRRALEELESRLDGNSQVFIYYSGHGGRQLVQEENGSERCAESLITVDGTPLIDTELEARLKRISQNAQKTIMFIDACHSGGVTTRAAGPKAYTPKSYIAPGTSCTKPTNVLTRNIQLVKAPGSGGGNFVHIAAARDSEISLDQPGRGGVASQAWLACLSGAARDTDGSGGLSADEIKACAQSRIDEQLKNAQGFLPHHVSLTGNSAMVLSYAVAESPPRTESPPPAPAAAPVPPAPTAPAASPAPATPSASAAPPGPPVAATSIATSVASPAPQPAPARPAAAAATATAPLAAPPAQRPATEAAAAQPRMSPLAAVNDIYNSRDDRRLVTVSAPKTQLRIGKDPFDFTVSSREGGYLYVLMVGSDGRSFDMLFPNQLDGKNLLAPGVSLRLPGARWQITADGPPGRNTLLFVVADAPREFAAAGLKPSGPFSSVEAVAAKNIQLVTAGAGQTPADECAGPPATRTLAVQKRCSTSYAAALLTIEEVR